jgi:hypothetical protein
MLKGGGWYVTEYGNRKAGVSEAASAGTGENPPSPAPAAKTEAAPPTPAAKTETAAA